MTIKTYSEALRLAQKECLQDKKCLLMGLGVPDPKGIFGSTLNLQKEFGKERVFDIPLSENAVTGMAIGLAIKGFRPIITHQRVDFALTSTEQIINQIAKWNYMFDGAMNLPLLIRMIIGRGWGQGPQHSQSLYSIFAHVPGLKIIAPATPSDAKGMIISAYKDNNPVLCFEHRWLYGLKDEVSDDNYSIPIGKANLIREGKDLTIISSSYMTIEAIKAAKILNENNIFPSILDLRSISPLDKNAILQTVEKTGICVILDHSHISFGLASEISSIVNESLFGLLKKPTLKICLPDYPTPTSHALSKNYYPNSSDIAVKIGRFLGREINFLNANPCAHHDQPDKDFNGPF